MKTEIAKEHMDGFDVLLDAARKNELCQIPCIHKATSIQHAAICRYEKARVDGKEVIYLEPIALMFNEDPAVAFRFPDIGSGAEYDKFVRFVEGFK